MSSFIILDASALLAVALHEPGGEVVSFHMQSTPDAVIIHAVNALEVAYKLMDKGMSEEFAWTAASFGGAMRIEDTDQDIISIAARIKTKNPYLSLGDSFCLALAEEVRGIVLTSDKGFAKAKTSAEVIMIR